MIGERISTARKKQGLSQADLADLMEVTRQSVSKWEMDESDPEMERLPKLAKILGVSVDWFITGEQKTAEIIRNYPAWLEKLPGFAVDSAKKYGWIYGLRTMLAGIAIIGFAAIVYWMYYSFQLNTGAITKLIIPETGMTILFDPINQRQINFFELTGIGATFAKGIAIFGLIYIIIGIIEVIALRRWGKIIYKKVTDQTD